MTNNDFHSFCLTVAKEISYYSKAKRRQVGAVIAKDGNILAFGYNGTPSWFDNNCEDFYCKNPYYKSKCNEECNTCKYLNDKVDNFYKEIIKLGQQKLRED